MKDQYTETKEALCRILNLDPNVADTRLIAVVQSLKDDQEQSEGDRAKRAEADVREQEIQKIIKQAGGALTRQQAEIVARDRKAQAVASSK